MPVREELGKDKNKDDVTLTGKYCESQNEGVVKEAAFRT